MTTPSTTPGFGRGTSLTLRRLVRSRATAIIAIVGINLLGMTVPISALASTAYQACSATSPLAAGVQPCLFGPAPGFEMDGNTPVDTAAGVDWNATPFPYARTDFQFVGTGELDFAGGAKYSDKTFACTTNDTSENKDELITGSVAINTFGNGHQVGFFQFTRVSGSGDSFIDFVFSKSVTAAGFGCPPDRQVGDVIVTLTYTNGGAAKAVALTEWNGTGFTDIGAGSIGTNWDAALSADGTFGEGAVDFTNVFDTNFSCHSFGSAYMDSRSSQSVDAQMKDISGLGLPPLCKNPTVATLSSSTGSSVAPGTVVSDTATVTGVAGSGNPTGSVHFRLCGPLASATGCATGGTDIGSTSTGVAGTTNGNPTETFTSGNSAALNGIGTYCWGAAYTAGSTTNYLDASGPTDATHECFTVVGNTTTTTVSSAGGAQLPGVSVTDTATVLLNAPATGATPAGTVTFKLCDPSASCTQVGNPVGLTSGSATSSSTSSTLAIGKYCWEATYTPAAGASYNGSTELTHPDAECFTTGKQPTTTSTGVLSQTVDVRSGSATVHDTSDTPVFVPANNTLTPGTVTFKLYGPSTAANCGSTAVYTSAAIAGSYAAGHVTAATGSLSLATAGISSSGTYWWVATYSGDAYNNGSSSTCGSEAVQSVDASITITPQTATNAVGSQHVFTITFTAVPAGTTPTNFVISPAISPTTGLTTNTNSCASPSVTANVASCTYTINSDAAGTYTLNASGSVTMGGITVARSTSGDPGPGGSGAATKTYVDADISITPHSATNEVGQEHVFTITYTAIPGGGGAPSAFSITPTLSPTTGLTTNTSTCASPSVVANVATCTYTINSGTAGTYTLNASGSSTMGGVTVTRSTSGNHGPGGSTAASKTYVDAGIAITPPTAVNEVGHAHVFTVTLTAIPAGATPSGFSISPSLSPTTALTQNDTTCASPTVVGNAATCTYTISSDSAGTYTLNATGHVTMGGVLVTRSTSSNPGPGGSGPAVKHYVDGSITISPSAVNEVGHPHVFTVVYTAIPGGAGTPGAFSISPSVTPAPGSLSTTCGTPTLGVNTATCTMTINSASAGTFTADASGSSTIGGVTVTRSTSSNPGPGGSGSATKTYVDALIAITPQDATNIVGHAHVFTVTLTAIPSGTTTSAFSITPALSPTTGLTQNDNTCASPTVVGNVATCTYTINSDNTGTYTLNASGHVAMGGVTVTRSTSGNTGPGGSGPAVKHYVSAMLTITPTTATNEVGSSHVFTLTLTATPGTAGPPSNFVISPTLSPTTNLTQNSTTCANVNVVGNVATCTYTIDSGTAGAYILNATGAVTIGGQTIHLTTVGGAGVNGPATKHYVDASIAVNPQRATNVVTHQHVFTITLTAMPGDAGAPGGFGITPVLSPTANLTTNTNTCATPQVAGNVATCTYTINSSTEGVYTLNATGSVTMGGVTVTRSTSGDSGPGGSGPATKTYVAPGSSLVKAERDVTNPDLTQSLGGFAAGPISASQGDVIEYQLTYSNTGKGAAGNVVVTDAVPSPHASYLAGSCTGGTSCTYDSAKNALTWSLGNMAAGSSAVLGFRITLATDFPSGVLTSVSNFGVVTTTEEGSKPSNTVVANVQPAVQVVLGISLPKAGFMPTSQGPGWLVYGLVALLIAALLASATIVVARRAEPVAQPISE